jgi:hypothetical protein
MIALLLAVLVGGATFLGLDRFASVDGTVAFAAAIFAAVLFESIRDTLQNRHDRLVARMRWYELDDNDRERTARRNQAALRRILRG